MTTRPLLRAYVDETGDRGTSGRSSAYFAFACVLIADEDEAELRAAMSQLRTDLHIPAGKALHWNDHVKSFARRQHVTARLTALQTVTLNYVLVEKRAIPASAGMRADQTIFYNFAAGMVLERALLAARDWPGGPRDTVVRFGHVKGFDHRTTLSYFAHRRSQQIPHWLPWHLLSGAVHFDGMAHWDGLQAADQYAGMLNVAIKPNAYGNYEYHHFIEVIPQLRKSPSGAIRNYGFKHLGNDASLAALPWWKHCKI